MIKILRLMIFGLLAVGIFAEAGFVSFLFAVIITLRLEQSLTIEAALRDRIKALEEAPGEVVIGSGAEGRNI